MIVRPPIAAITLPPFDPLNLRAAELRRAGRPVISMGQAVPDFGPPQSAMAALRESVNDPETFLYSTDPGRPSLRAALAERFRAHGLDAAAGDLIITAGGNHAFALAALTTIQPGDDVLLPSPYFTNHEMMLRAVSASPREIPLAHHDGFALRWSAIEPHLTPRTRAVVLCTPSNPTGAVIPASEGTRIVSELARRGVLVICDEAYMRFLYAGEHWSAASVPGWRDNVIVVGTFSKSFGMTGLRMGYLLASAAVCAEATKVQDAMIICAPVVSQMALEAAVRHDWDYPGRFLDELARRRQLLADGLRTIPALEWTKTDGGYFAFVRVADERPSAVLANDLLEREFLVTIPGSAFGVAGERHLRLSFGAATQDQIRDAIARLARFFAQA